MDWSEIAHSCGCIDIACLNAADVSTDALRQTLAEWQETGNEGALAYVDGRADILTEPFQTRPWAASAVVVSFAPVPDAYCRLRLLPEAAPGSPAALIAPYAMNEDYHLTGAKRLEAVVQALKGICADAVFECCVDTRPVMEKQFARSGGLGVQGINSLIRNETHGSQLYLGVIFTSLTLPTARITREVKPKCEECQRCRRACPNNVFADGHFEVRRCRAWLASEFRGALDGVQQRLLGDTLFGCGRCSSACPATEFSPQRPYRVDALELLRMPSARLREIIRGTILEHTGVTVLKRNAAAVLGNGTSADEWEQMCPELLELTNSPVIKETLLMAKR